MKEAILEYLFWVLLSCIFIGIGMLMGIELEKASKTASPVDNIVIIKRCGKKIISNP